MLLETWDTDRIGNQHKIFGRTKEEGAPVSGKAEFDTPNFTAKGPDGDPLIECVSHRFGSHGKQRRSDDPPTLLQLHRRPRRQWPTQRRLAVHLVSKRSPRFYSFAEPTRRPRPAQPIHPAHRISYLCNTACA